MFNFVFQSVSIELQGRLFGDLLFLLGDYVQASAAYRASVNDYRHGTRTAKQLGENYCQ